MTDRYGARQGQIVYGSDGVRLGRVFHCDDFGFVVVKGIVFREDYPVFYDEVLSAEGDEVRLRFPSSALVREEDAEPWDPPRDPVGSAGGVDLEPLRAGMAEIDEVQERLLAIEAGLVEAVARSSYGGWAAWARIARQLRGGEPANAAPAVARAAHADELGEHALRGSAIAELEHHIAEEVEDYERGAACASPDALSEAAAAVAAARLQRRLVAAARRRAGAIPARAGGAVLRTGRDGVPRPRDGVPRPVGRSTTGRIDYARSAPDALAPLRRLETYVRRSGLEPPLLELVRLLASRLNGCAPCVELHGGLARRRGITGERLEALAKWQASPLFTERERAALAWSEAVTRIPAARVEEDVYRRAREQFGERGLIDLTMAVVAINGWNRLAVAFESGLGAYRVALT